MKVIKLAIRSILHFRMYSGINMLGLALSLACVIVIFRYVHGELTVDRFNENLDRIYVTTYEMSIRPDQIAFLGIENRNRETTFVDLREHSGVEKSSSFILFVNDEIDVDTRKYDATLLAADSNFLKIIDYPLILGVDKLSEPNSALITESYAQKLFGNENPIGKTFRYSGGEILTITGIIGQTSTKATLSFDIIVSYYLSNYWSRGSQTLVQLYTGVDYQTINKQYEDFFDMPRWGYQIRYQLFPLSKVYFDKSIINYGVFKQGNYNYVTVLIAVGILILLVGIINYINIYTVVVLRRGRELGIKKVFGAEGHNIFIQLLTENLLMTGLALVLALIFAGVAHPFVTNVLQLDQIPNISFNILLSVVILLSLPLITTLYPFFRHHFSTPVDSIRNLDKIRGGSLRRIFLTFQFIITMAMIIVSLFFIKQLQFMLNADPGYRTNDIIKVQFLKFQTDYNIRNAEESRMKRERENQIADEITYKMNACPLFTNWTYGDSPNKFSGRGTPFRLPGEENKNINIVWVSESWLKLFDIQLKEGRLWNDDTDIFTDYLLIVTESVLKLYGITDFNDALLQPENRIWFSTVGDMSTNPPYRIVGVVKDFDYLHLSQVSEPTAFCYTGNNGRTKPLIASIVPGRTQEAIEFLRNLHQETVGGEFSYSFVEDEIREMYKEDKKIAMIYSIFTVIAIFISALGLFSMSLFDVQQRRKEIAIRKVNGATAYDIIRLLLKKYFMSLAISFVIAAPVALFAINRYLEDFANKAPISWWLFAVALAITAAISLLTLIYQTQKAASQNPAEVVKSE